MAMKISTAGFLICVCLVALNFLDVSYALDEATGVSAEEGEKIPYEYNCAVYFEQLNGVRKVKECPLPLVFNPANSRCDTVDKVPNCQSGGFVNLNL